RQLRLRDMAGLVVIDFIDMDYNSNVRKVERAMKDSLKSDRARIQVGRISGFGLMEMSRQRLRTGVLEATTRECPHCDGTGLVRTASSAGLSALRLIEDEAAKGKGTTISLAASTEAAVYLLNSKRGDLAEIEDRYNVAVEVVPEGEDEGAKMSVSSSGPRPAEAPKFQPIVDDDDSDDHQQDDYDDSGDDSDDDDRGPKKRRRRGGRGGNKSNDGENDNNDSGSSSNRQGNHNGDEDDDDGAPKKKRRRRGGRGRRGGKNRSGSDQNNGSDGDTKINAKDAEKLEQVSEHVKGDMAVVAGPSDTPETAEAAAKDEKPKTKRKPRKKPEPEDNASADDKSGEEKPKRARQPRKKAEPKTTDASEKSAEQSADGVASSDKPKRRRTPRKKAETDEAADVSKQLKDDIAVVAGPKDEAQTAEAAEKSSSTAAEKPAEKPRRGWWQRTFGE
ncbi:MAG: ribonuclease E/G, partial [Pontixanthobacter sp.]